MSTPAYKIEKYPDGTSYVTININRQPSFTFRLNEYKDIWTLKQIVEAFNRNGIEPTITIPNLIDAQADRRFEKTQSFGLKLVLKELINMKADFRVFHPHNPEVVEMGFDLFDKNVTILDNSSFIGYDSSLVLGKLFVKFDGRTSITTEDNLILMSSDAGGFKPLMKLCDKLDWSGEVYSASKSRKYENGKSKLTQIIDREDFGGKDILIIDDICVYGGTFKGLAKLLRERNCGKLYLAVSHMTIQHLGDDPVTDYFDTVFTTNSKFNEYYVSRKKIDFTPNNLEIIKMF